MRALIIVDIQHDFIAGGRLAVPQGEQIIGLVNTIQVKFDLVVATQDWHPPGHKSFASSHPGSKPFETIMLQGMEQVLWPDHCVQGSHGASFPASLDTSRVEAIIRKGMDPGIDSYSGFYDNGHLRSTGLAGYLREREVKSVYVCGLAADYCVFFTAKDAIAGGFDTCLIRDATRPIEENGFVRSMSEITRLGGRIIESRDLL